MTRRGHRLVAWAWLAAVVALLAGAAAAQAATAPTAFVANANAGSLTPFDTVTNVVGSTVPVGIAPVAVAITPDGTRAYVANSSGNSVTVIDTATRTVTATIPVGSTPFGVAIMPDGTKAYVSNLRGNSVSVIDLATNTVVATIPVGRFPEGVAIRPDGATAYVVNDGDSNVSVIDTATNAVVATVTVGVVPGPVAVTPDGATAYVGGGGATPALSAIDLATNTVVATIPAGNQPFDIAVTPDGTKAYSANFVGGSVTVIDVASNTATATISGAPFRTPTALAVTPDGSTLEVADFNANTTIPVSTLTNAVGTPIAGFSGPEGIAITPDQPPHAAFSRTIAAAGRVSSFDASASTDPDGSVASYVWDFGDGSSPVTTTSATTTHTYASSGPVLLTLTVVDDAGCSTRLIFTGRTASCNGSSVATASQLVNVPPPPPYDATVLASSPVGYWRMDEPSGTVMTDSSGNHNDGTYLGGVTLGVPGALTRHPDTAASFDGINDSARVPDSASLHTGATFTLEGWIKRSSTAKSYELLNKGTNGYQLTVMSAASGSKVFLRKAGVTTIAQSSAAVPFDGAYHFVAATMSGAGTARIYIDGSDVTQAVAGGGVQAIASTTQPVNIGGGGSAEAKYDELAVFGTALTAAQILVQDRAAAT